MPRRTLTLLVALAILGVPAAAMRALCVGKSCEEPASATSGVPFCSLPEDLRELIARGFREGRSAELLAVARETDILGGTAFEGSKLKPVWPSDRSLTRAEVPVVFSGAGVSPGAEVARGVTLDRIAPTVAEMIGLERAHPEVRSGTAVEGVASGEAPSLVVEIVWKGVGSDDVEDSAYLRELLDEGAGTLRASTGSLPLDPAATIATIGTGGLPYQHGMTGSLVRNDEGQLVTAWGKGSPVSVIATLGDDLDEELKQEPLVGLVGSAPADRGLIGGRWYIDVDRDDVVLGARDPAAEVDALLTRGYGNDATPDLLAVVLEGPLPRLEAATQEIVTSAERATEGSSAVVVTATGSALEPDGVEASAVARALDRLVEGPDLVEAATPGGLFLDQAALSRSATTVDEVQRKLLSLEMAVAGGKVVDDAFPAIAVSFARYC